MCSKRPQLLVLLLAAGACIYIVATFSPEKSLYARYSISSTWNAAEIPVVEYRDPLLQPLRVLLQPDVSFCSNLSFLVVVHTRLGENTTRNMWRTTYGREELTGQYNYKLLFAVGTNGSYEDVLKDEHDLHGDILQTDFIDSYKNLTLKQLSHLRYFSSACQHPTMLLKVDDDVVWRVDAVSRAASQAALAAMRGNSEPPYISCLVWRGMPVMRDPDNKWFVPPSLYAPNEYPRYCSGMAYLASHSATTALTKSANEAEFFWVDDVFITGFLRLLAGVQLQDTAYMYQLQQITEAIWDNDSIAFLLVDISEFEKYFNEMIKRQPKQIDVN